MNDKFDERTTGVAQFIVRRGALKNFGHGLGLRGSTLLALTVVAALAGLTAAHADKLTVLNALDKGAASLRSAISGPRMATLSSLIPAWR